MTSNEEKINSYFYIETLLRRECEKHKSIGNTGLCSHVKTVETEKKKKKEIFLYR